MAIKMVNKHLQPLIKICTFFIKGARISGRNWTKQKWDKNICGKEQQNNYFAEAKGSGEWGKKKALFGGGSGGG